MRLCHCRPRPEAREAARDAGRLDRRRMVTLEGNPYPFRDEGRMGCWGVVLDATCALADAWEQGYAEEERAMYESALGQRMGEVVK